MDSEYIITPTGSFVSTDELYHHGIKGMKWGVRKKSYYDNSGKTSASSKQSNNEREQNRRKNIKRSVRIGAAVAGTALAAYGGYKLSRYVKNKNKSAKIVNKLLEQSITTAKTTSLNNSAKDVVKSSINSAPKSSIPKVTVPKTTVNRTPINTTAVPKITVPKTPINTASIHTNYDFESLMKANSDLLKRSMDELRKGL